MHHIYLRLAFEFESYAIRSENALTLSEQRVIGPSGMLRFLAGLQRLNPGPF